MKSNKTAKLFNISAEGAKSVAMIGSSGQQRRLAAGIRQRRLAAAVGMEGEVGSGNLAARSWKREVGSGVRQWRPAVGPAVVKVSKLTS